MDDAPKLTSDALRQFSSSLCCCDLVVSFSVSILSAGPKGNMSMYGNIMYILIYTKYIKVSYKHCILCTLFLVVESFCSLL